MNQREYAAGTDRLVCEPEASVNGLDYVSGTEKTMSEETPPVGNPQDTSGPVVL